MLSWPLGVVMMLRGHKVSLQATVNKVCSALGLRRQVVTASAYSQAWQKVAPEVYGYLNEATCEEYYTRYGDEGEVVRATRLHSVISSLRRLGSSWLSALPASGVCSSH